ncbi:hypothetical protein N0B51_06155 [Tsuneonella sp. YG55]|uniref:Uncharacterized protein n=1 Tax=Tsuneonella litorea TaxID=2976475 RepID=A0A9X3AKL7_9SPHN|nr:sulfotransferase [Tsuneonella litorea]MCT2558559.1 hypothetical protein [Tsuneonella litorea]
MARKTRWDGFGLPGPRGYHMDCEWGPLCKFLAVPKPAPPLPRVNSRDELTAANDEAGGLPPDFETMEKFGRDYIAAMRAKAFA